MSEATPRQGAGKIEAHRGDLEELADSDLPCAEIAAALLEVADEQ